MSLTRLGDKPRDVLSLSRVNSTLSLVSLFLVSFIPSSAATYQTEKIKQKGGAANCKAHQVQLPNHRQGGSKKGGHAREKRPIYLPLSLTSGNALSA